MSCASRETPLAEPLQVIEHPAQLWRLLMVARQSVQCIEDCVLYATINQLGMMSNTKTCSFGLRECLI